MEVFQQNLKFAVRQLWRSRGFTLTVIVTLALSIGANTAIFSLVNALMLKSMPYPQPERMGAVFATISGAEASDAQIALDGRMWEQLRDNVPSVIPSVSSGGASGVNLQAGSRVQYLEAGRISADYFEVLGLHPLLGRSISEDEDRPNGPKAAVLSYALWRDTFGANPAALGQSILLKGEPYTVVGVLPDGATTPMNAALYTALQPSTEGEGEGTNFDVIVRLRDGATWQQADAEINRAWAGRIASYASHTHGGKIVYHAVPLQQSETASLRPQVLTLMLAAGFILLIACANLAGLTLVRVLRRTPEFATRLALGASRWQIQKQLWVETLLLALGGGAAGIAVGFLALRGLLMLLPEHFLPVASVTLDARVLGFTLLVSLATSVFFGMLPAFAVQRLDLRSAIASRSAAGGDRMRVRQGLIATEIALTVVLLAASGLLIRTLVHLETLPPGFNPVGVMTAKASLDDAKYHDPVAFDKLLRESTIAMRQIPGVQDAAVGLSLPYERGLNNGIALSEGANAGKRVATGETYVTPGYFSTLEMPLLSGRAFTDEDGPTTEPVAIVNQTFVQKFFQGRDPVGHYIDKNVRIVGVVADVSVVPGLDGDAPLSGEETMYIPATQVDPKLLAVVHVWFQPSWIVRTNGSVPGLTAQMQRALASADSNLPFSGFYSMRDLLAKTLVMQRMEVALLGTMAGLALLLSTVGIFALVANTVVQRTREIGIRIALGSSIRQAMVHTGAPGVKAAVVGLVLGLMASAAALRTMKSFLYGVEVYDAPTGVAVIAILMAVTLVATTVPTLKIAGVNPAKTLRED